LPDGIFSNPKSQFGKILEALGMKNVGIFIGNLKYFTAICFFLPIALWQFSDNLA
jgi:hypothetical protein